MVMLALKSKRLDDKLVSKWMLFKLWARNLQMLAKWNSLSIWELVVAKKRSTFLKIGHFNVETLFYYNRKCFSPSSLQELPRIHNLWASRESRAVNSGVQWMITIRAFHGFATPIKLLANWKLTEKCSQSLKAAEKENQDLTVRILHPSHEPLG